MTKLIQSLAAHPCADRSMKGHLSHRSGGFGGTCERCGTKIEGPNNQPTDNVISWTPIPRPRPYQPGSLNEAIFAITGSVVQTDAIIDLILSEG